MQESDWNQQRGGGRRVDGMRDKRASLDVRTCCTCPSLAVGMHGIRSVEYSAPRVSAQSKIRVHKCSGFLSSGALVGA